jgi:hypothetical protein
MANVNNFKYSSISLVSTKVELEIKFNIDVELIHENAVESRWISIFFAGEA